jgi:hypothetical protein
MNKLCEGPVGEGASVKLPLATTIGESGSPTSRRIAAMALSPKVFAVFGHFQNLNLLALIEDLRAGRTARQAWLSGHHLCPVAHGLRRGDQVLELRSLGQSADLGVGCDYAARHLGAHPADVLRFVRSWDENELGAAGLLAQLEEVWQERLVDAEVMQEVLHGGGREPAFDGLPEVHHP